MKTVLIVAPTLARAKGYRRLHDILGRADVRFIMNPDQLQGYTPENAELHYLGVPNDNVGGSIYRELTARGFRDNDYVRA